MTENPKVAITMGDAAGIGPEISAKVMNEREVYEICSPLIIGDAKVIENAIKITNLDLEVNPIKEPTEGSFKYGVIDVLDYNNVDLAELEFGKVSEMCGKAAVIYTEDAVKLAMENEIQAMVSAPLNKESMRQAGYSYEGQTEIVGTLTGSDRYSLMIIFNGVRLLQVTTHVALREACDLITTERVLNMITLAHDACKNMFGIEEPIIAVPGLNPHSGEDGLFGMEEIEEIVPAIEMAKERGIETIGPIPADVIFIEEKRESYDAALALYHDQANIPMKLLAFRRVLTLVVGVPIIRTSVGHGTAFDIAGKNIADHLNLLESVKLAAELGRKKLTSE